MDSVKQINGVSNSMVQESEEKDIFLKDSRVTSGTAYPLSFGSSKDEYGSQYSSYNSCEQARMNAHLDRINHLGYEQVYPDVDDEMASERKRLETFIQWPKASPVKPTELARAGFYFKGPGDLVSCFSCDLQFKGWAEGDDPFEEHRRKRPNCIFILEREREKYAVTSKREPVSSEFTSGNRTLRPPFSTTKTYSDHNIQYNCNEQNLPVYSASGHFHQSFLEEYPSHYMSSANPSITSQQLQSYKSHYVDQNPAVAQESLAYGGGQFIPHNLPFYCPQPTYPGYNLTNYAGVSSPNWYSQQQNHSYLQTPAHFSTTKIQPNEPRVPHNSYNQDLNNYSSTSVSQESMPSAPVSHPYIRKHPDIRNSDIPVLHPMPHEGPHVRTEDTLHITSPTDLQSEHHRMTTFVDWPEDCPVRPWELASAGFFYLGNHDNVKCYKCGVALRNWEPQDTPWEEHRRWSPDCPLVISHYRGKNSYRPVEDQEKVGPRLPPQAKKQSYSNPAQAQRSQFQFEPSEREENYVKQVKIQEGQQFQGYHNTAEVHEPIQHEFSHQGRNQDYYFQRQESTSSNEYNLSVSRPSPWMPTQQELLSMNNNRNLQLCEQSVSTPVAQTTSVSSRYTPRQTVSNPTQNPLSPQVPSHTTSLENEGSLTSSDVLRAIEMGFTHDAIDEAIAIKTQRTGSGFTNLEDLMQSLLDNQNNATSAQQSAASTNTPETYSSNTDPESQVIDREEQDISQREQLNFPLVHSISYHQDQSASQKQALRRSNSAPPGSSTISSALNESVRELERTQEERLICKICMDAEVGIVFLPCGHISCCPNCASGLDLCPMCRMPIHKIHRTFLS